MANAKGVKTKTRNPMAGLLRVIGRPQRVEDKRHKEREKQLRREVWV